MARPQQNLTGQSLGTLVIGERVKGPHPRYKYTCTACGHEGETDTRYLGSGCSACRARLTPSERIEQVLAAYPGRAEWLNKRELLDTLRTQPEARYYYGKDLPEVTITEDDFDIVIDLMPLKDLRSVDRCIRLSKLDQRTTQDLAKPGTEGPPPLRPGTPLHPELEPLPEPITPTAPKDIKALLFTPPEGALEIQEGHWMWFTDKYPENTQPPEYINTWMEAHRDPTYRKLQTNGRYFVLVTEAKVKTDLTDDFDLPS